MKKTRTIEVSLKNMSVEEKNDEMVLLEYDKEGMIDSSNLFDDLFNDILSEVKVSLTLNCDIECLATVLYALEEKGITGINLSVKNVELSE